jgi:WKF domain
VNLRDKMKGSTETKVVKIIKNKKIKKSKKNDGKHQKGNSKADHTVENIDDENVDDEVAEVKPKSEPVVQPRRDFSTDLLGYISSWNYRETSGQWKFNKILQTWALDNCFEKQRVDAVLFKALIPYLLSIKGSAVDRLLARAEEIITKSCEDEDNEEDDDEDDGEENAGGAKKRRKDAEGSSAIDKGSSLKRAIKIKFEFSRLNTAAATVK